MLVNIATAAVFFSMYPVHVGNTSILPFYFKGDGPVLITNESLVAELSLNAHKTIWEIHINGQSIVSVNRALFSLVL